MAIPEEILAEIKYRNDIENVISPYVNLKRRGKNLIGLCPFHNEKTPSFTVYPENGSFYCFGCGVGGDIFTFTRTIENLDYIEAVKLLAERSGVTIHEDGYDNTLQNVKKRILDINREAARFYHNFLKSEQGKWAFDYLVGRGLEPATIKRFGIGAAPDRWDALYKYLKQLGYNDEEMLQANVISRSSSGKGCYDRFRNRVMFPIINLRGHVVAFSGRAAPGEEKSAKYVNSTDTLVYKKGQNLFGINLAKNDCAERIILVEGNLDVISMHQAGFTNTVAPLGTAFTDEQAKLLSRYTKEILILFDADAAGQKAVDRAIEILKNTGLAIRILVLPECKDPDEYIKKNGAARLKLLLENAVSEVEYKILHSADGVELSSVDGKVTFLNKVANVLATINDPITVDMYAGMLAEDCGVTKDALLSSINERRKKLVNTARKKEINEIISPKINRNDVNPERTRAPRAAAAEETFLSVVIQHPDMFETATKLLPPEKMVTSLNRRIYEAIGEVLRSNTQFDLSMLGSEFTVQETGYLAKLQNSVNAEKNPKKVLSDCAAVILKESMLKSFKSDSELTVDEWQEKMQKIMDMKKGE